MEIYLNKTDSFQEALSKAKPNDVIYLSNRIYNEKIKITTPNITIIGHAGKTVIKNKDYYNKTNIDNKEFTTVRTYTLMVAADNVTIKNLSIENTAAPSSVYGQAVALHVIGDNFIAENISIYGAQDTILSGPIPYDLTLRYKDLLPADELSQKKSHQYFKSCYIEGDIDFIFGCGIALFEDCHIHSLAKGYISAPSHPEEYEFGFVFKNCKLTAAEGNNENVYLSRPWRPYGQACFINCTIGTHINKAGFHCWSPERAKTCRMSQYNTMPTDDIANFARTLSKQELTHYSNENILKS